MDPWRRGRLELSDQTGMRKALEKKGNIGGTAKTKSHLSGCLDPIRGEASHAYMTFKENPQQ